MTLLIRRNPILRGVAHVLIPAILLYAFYVQFHGEYGAGGGFQAGAIFAVGIVLYMLVYGTKRVKIFFSIKRCEEIAALGLLGYITTGLAAFLWGGNFLDYSVLSDDPQMGQRIGIFLIELSVGVTIVGIVTLIFSLISRQKIEPS